MLVVVDVGGKLIPPPHAVVTENATASRKRSLLRGHSECVRPRRTIQEPNDAPVPMAGYPRHARASASPPRMPQHIRRRERTSTVRCPLDDVERCRDKSHREPSRAATSDASSSAGRRTNPGTRQCGRREWKGDAAPGDDRSRHREPLDAAGAKSLPVEEPDDLHLVERSFAAATSR